MQLPSEGTGYAWIWYTLMQSAWLNVNEEQCIIRNGPPSEGRFAKFTAKFTPRPSSVDASIEPLTGAAEDNAA